MKRIILLSLLLLSFPLITNAQISASFNATFIYASPHSISGNNIFYLVINAEGSASLSGSYTVNSITTYLAGYGIPSYSPPNGLVVSKPFVINNTVYFICVPDKKSINPSSPNINVAYLAYVKFNGKWGSLKYLINTGFTEDFYVFKNKIYVIWYPNESSNTPYLVVMNLKGKIISNSSLPIPNVVSIAVLSENGLVVANSTNKLPILQLASGSISSVSLPTEEVFIISNGIREVPAYHGLSPSQFCIINSSTLLLDYSSNDYSYVVEYNVNNDIYYVKEFEGTSTISYSNGIIVVNSVYRNGFTINYYNYVYNMNWTLLYSNSGSSSFPSISLEVAEATTTSPIYLFMVKVSGKITSLFPPSYSVSSTPTLVYIGEPPQPFVIKVDQLYYHGYTILDLSWNESVPSTFLVYLNGTIIAKTLSTTYYLNLTRNETVNITIKAMNQFGSISESKVIYVKVYKSTVVPTTSITSVSTSKTFTTKSYTESSSTKSTTTTTTQLHPFLFSLLIIVIMSVILLIVLRKK